MERQATKGSGVRTGVRTAGPQPREALRAVAKHWDFILSVVGSHLRVLAEAGSNEDFEKTLASVKIWQQGNPL